MQTTAFNGKFGKGADERNSFNPTGGTERRMGVKGHLWNGIIKGINSSFEGTYPNMGGGYPLSTFLPFCLLPVKFCKFHAVLW